MAVKSLEVSWLLLCISPFKWEHSNWGSHYTAAKYSSKTSFLCFILVNFFIRMSVIGYPEYFLCFCSWYSPTRKLETFPIAHHFITQSTNWTQPYLSQFTHSKVALSHMIFTRQVWLLKFQVNVTKIKCTYKFSSLVTLAIKCWITICD